MWGGTGSETSYIVWIYYTMVTCSSSTIPLQFALVQLYSVVRTLQIKQCGSNSALRPTSFNVNQRRIWLSLSLSMTKNGYTMIMLTFSRCEQVLLLRNCLLNNYKKFVFQNF